MAVVGSWCAAGGSLVGLEYLADECRLSRVCYSHCGIGWSETSCDFRRMLRPQRHLARAPLVCCEHGTIKM
jgi:hypothetical protein